MVRGLGAASPDAARDLLPVVYQHLHRIAELFFRQQPRHHTLQPTALIHEAWLKLVDHETLDADDRARFVRVAARAMRQVLVDHARGRAALKRGGDRERITLAGLEAAGGADALDLLALDEALTALVALDERQGAVVELRFFGGLSVEEAAAALGVSPRTVEIDWRMAKAWLNRALEAPGR